MPVNQTFELSGGFSDPPRLAGKALVIICSYRGGTRRKQPWQSPLRGTNALTLLGLRRFIAAYRDHYANPRSPAYQAALVRGLLEKAHFDTFEIVVDSGLDLALDDIAIEGAAEIAIADLRSLSSNSLSRFDAIAIVYPDALGLSWGWLEKLVMQAEENVAIVNGRRRLFRLDLSTHRALAWRRFLANTRIVQILLGISAYPLGAMLALKDKMRRRA